MLYWIYDFPNWQLCLMILALFEAVTLGGLLAVRPAVGRLLGRSGVHNDVVSYFLSAYGVFYGLSLGLIAVATWEDYSAVDGLASEEASTVAVLYRDLDGYPAPARRTLQRGLRDYLTHIVEAAWPAHQRGRSDDEAGDRILDEFEGHLMAFEPTTEGQKILHSDAVEQYNRLMEKRRLRLLAVGTGLPAILWVVVILGAALNIALIFLFWLDNLRFHLFLAGILAAFIGLLIFLTAAMDNPMRGEFSVTPDAYRDVLERVVRSDSGRRDGGATAPPAQPGDATRPPAR